MDSDFTRPGVWRYGKELKPEEINIIQEIGRNIRYQRLFKNMPLREVCTRAGISRGTLHKMECGTQGVSMCSYIKVFVVLGIAEELLEVGSKMVILKKKHQERVIFRKRASKLYY